MSTIPKLHHTISRLSLADSVYETLVEAIVHGQLLPDTILSSVELAKQLNVSRTPVTEAIQRLCHDGLIEQTNNRKARVVRLSECDIREIYEMRIQLEGGAAEKSAKRLTDDELHALQKEAKRLKAARKEIDWHERAIEFDLKFHDTLANAAGNGRLKQDILRYRRLVRCFCRMTGSQENLIAAFEEHMLILEMLTARKPAAARKAMTQHIQHRYAAVKSELFSDKM